jgi:hypothetical protein
MAGKRAVGLVAIGVLEILMGGYSASVAWNFRASELRGEINSIGPLCFWSFAGLSLLLPLGIGIILRNNLARVLNILLMLVVFTLALYKAIFGHYTLHEILLVSLPCVLLSGGIIFYLTRPAVMRKG